MTRAKFPGRIPYMKTKKEVAIEYISKMRQMKGEELDKLLQKEMGVDLHKFFNNYSYNLITQNPQKVVESAISLMTLGYLIKANEEKLTLKEAFSQKPAQA